MSFSKLDYCQFLISSQVNYTLTNLADHLQSWSHDIRPKGTRTAICAAINCRRVCCGKTRAR